MRKASDLLRMCEEEGGEWLVFSHSSWIGLEGEKFRAWVKERGYDCDSVGSPDQGYIVYYGY